LHGIGNVPAYRGTIYIVIKDLPLEPYGNRRPYFEAEVASDAVVTPVSKQSVSFDPTSDAIGGAQAGANFIRSTSCYGFTPASSNTEPKPFGEFNGEATVNSNSGYIDYLDAPGENRVVSGFMRGQSDQRCSFGYRSTSGTLSCEMYGINHGSTGSYAGVTKINQGLAPVGFRGLYDVMSRSGGAYYLFLYSQQLLFKAKITYGLLAGEDSNFNEGSWRSETDLSPIGSTVIAMQAQGGLVYCLTDDDKLVTYNGSLDLLSTDQLSFNRPIS
jgi:hypothetical protein